MGQLYDPEITRRKLKETAYQLRQDAIKTGDYESWRISRLVRDASMTDSKDIQNRIERIRKHRKRR